ncbi:MAG: hypothetical protein GXO86_04840 [Chlorobi bacterium]|nr:hypothetical protein [Chlorobiota bacterium]
MKTRVIIYVALLILLSACHKNKEDVDDEPVPTVENKISIGQNENMQINVYDTTIIGDYNWPVRFNLDINNDSIYDIQFECVVNGSPEVGDLPNSTIKVLHNNIGIFGLRDTDTIWEHIYTHTYNKDDGTVLITKYHAHVCTRKDSSDKIYKIKPLSYFFPLDQGDTISEYDVYVNDKSLIADTDCFYIEYGETHGDTTINHYQSCGNSCFIPFPLETESYIGVMFLNEKKLGWIRFELLKKHVIHVFESGVQK